MTVCEYSKDHLVALLPLPDQDANKYTRGRLTAVVGSARYPGAACLVAAAGQRMGAGYTEVITDSSAVAGIRAFRPSLVVRSWDGWKPVSPAPASDLSSGAGSGSDPDSSSSPDSDSGSDFSLSSSSSPSSDLDLGSSPSPRASFGLDANNVDASDVDFFPNVDSGAAPVSDSSLELDPAPGLDVLFAPTRPRKPHAYVVGAGFDAQDQKATSLVYAVLKHAGVPVLVDGGGLGALATKKGQRLLRRRFILGWPTVVTPHAGEASRLAVVFGLPVDDRAELARLISLSFGVVAVVKGPDTFVSDGERTVLMAEGTPALAKAGTGDVLAGMIGALMAQGLASFDAAVLGATLHARAGCEAAERFTSIGVVAEDVLDAIPSAIRGLILSDGD